MDWRLQRAAKPISDEAARSAEALCGAPEDWRAWRSERGERELRCVLMTAWDPVGVGGVPEAWDEYDSYVAAVGQRLREGAADDDDGVERVGAYLQHVVRDFMALAPGNAVDDHHRASALVAWHEWSFRRGGRPPKEWIDDA